ncbi:MAG: hypothetical protein HY728_10500 [Candidatus Rokubacteria bacterium]|nr:hypothetical protein [Candidatus Rokubacteria bacterium]MBI4594633.1 hypothetical protein [Candidatus Rokubacteria bacterium]
MATRPADNAPSWMAHLNRLDGAMTRRDTYAMVYAWHLACLEARAVADWEGMLAVGEAALRIARATGFTLAFTAEARQALHVALFRAQRQRSRAGVHRIAEAFAALGDLDIVEQCHLIDDALYRSLDNPGPRS